MIGSGTTVTGRGIIIASHQGGTPIVIVTIAGEAAVAVTAEVVAEVGARIAPENETERGIGIEIVREIGREIAAGAGQTAELGPGAEVEVRALCMDLNKFKTVIHLIYLVD